VRHPWPRSIRKAYGAALRAREAYSPAPYPGRITLFRAQRQPRGVTDPYLGWGSVASGGVEVVEVPGTHVSIMSEPRLSALGDALRARVLAALDHVT
jgi:thioesterase domain-containing protein